MNRYVVYKVMNMSLSQRNTLFQSVGLVRPDDRGFSGTEYLAVIFKRAKESGKLEELASAIKNARGGDID